MHRNLKLTWQFYGPFVYYHLMCTALGLFLVVGTANALSLALPIKLISYGGMVFYQHYFHQHEYFYYRNAGFSMRRVYGWAMVIDMVLFVVLSVSCIIFK